jgi:hypothetical protein
VNCEFAVTYAGEFGYQVLFRLVSAIMHIEGFEMRKKRSSREGVPAVRELWHIDSLHVYNPLVCVA